MSRSLTTTRRFTIKRENVDRRIVDFSDVASGRRLPPLHPGKILRDEFLIDHSSIRPIRETRELRGSSAGYLHRPSGRRDCRASLLALW